MALSYRILIRIFVYLFALGGFTYVFADPDLWGHIKFGEEVWLDKAIPSIDKYSYTAEGATWSNHEWFSEITFYLIYFNFGSTGLLIFKMVLGLFIIHLLSSYYFSHEKNIPAYVLYFSLLTPIFALRDFVRPQMFTFLFTAFLVVILYRFYDGNRRVLFWTPLLFVFWINSHGGAVAGICIFGMVTAVELVRGFFNGEKQGRQLLPFFILSCLALLVNPYGYNLLLFFLETIPKPRAIVEWTPIPIFDTSFLSFKIFVLLFLLSLIYRGPRKRPWEIIMVSCGIFYAFRHHRHVAIAGILMTPYLLLQLAHFFNHFADLSSRLTQKGHALLKLALFIGIVLLSYNHFDKLRANNFQVRVFPAKVPMYAVRFMQENNINGKIMVPFGWGEYVIWKLPESRVSMDGRFRTVYSDSISHANNVFHSGAKGWEQTLEDYPPDIILTMRNNRELEQSQAWQKIYEDPIARIFIRKSDPPNAWLKIFQDKQLIRNNTMMSEEFP